MPRALLAAALFAATPVCAQTRADPAALLSRMLPHPVAERLRARFDAAESRGIPAGPLEQRALELAAKGVPVDRIEADIDRHSRSLEAGRQALRAGGLANASAEETDAAAAALHAGAPAVQVSALVRDLEGDRSASTQLFGLAALLSSGHSVEEALLLLRQQDRSHPPIRHLARYRAEAARPAVMGGRTSFPGRFTTTGRTRTRPRPPLERG
jgi:hypothetical protein